MTRERRWPASKRRTRYCTTADTSNVGRSGLPGPRQETAFLAGRGETEKEESPRVWLRHTVAALMVRPSGTACLCRSAVGAPIYTIGRRSTKKGNGKNVCWSSARAEEDPFQYTGRTTETSLID